MFKVFPSGNAVDVAQIKAFAIDDFFREGEEGYRVDVYGVGDSVIEADHFNSEEEAIKYIAELVAEFNGEDAPSKSYVPFTAESGILTTAESEKLYIDKIALIYCWRRTIYAVYSDDDYKQGRTVRVAIFDGSILEWSKVLGCVVNLSDNHKFVDDTESVVFNEQFSFELSINAFNEVFVTSQGVLAPIKKFQNYASALNYCENLKKKYDWDL